MEDSESNSSARFFVLHLHTICTELTRAGDVHFPQVLILASNHLFFFFFFVIDKLASVYFVQSPIPASSLSQKNGLAPRNWARAACASRFPKACALDAVVLATKTVAILSHGARARA